MRFENQVISNAVCITLRHQSNIACSGSINLCFPVAPLHCMQLEEEEDSWLCETNCRPVCLLAFSQFQHLTQLERKSDFRRIYEIILARFISCSQAGTGAPFSPREVSPCRRFAASISWSVLVGRSSSYHVLRSTRSWRLFWTKRKHRVSCTKLLLRTASSEMIMNLPRITVIANVIVLILLVPYLNIVRNLLLKYWINVNYMSLLHLQCYYHYTWLLAMRSLIFLMVCYIE